MSPTRCGFGFAQGKTMLWRRADLERAGGIAALAREVAEDAAATKVVRDAGLQGAARRPAVPAAARLPQRRRGMAAGRCAGRGCAARASSPISFPKALSGGVLPMIALAGIAAGARPAARCRASLRSPLRGMAAEMLLAAAAGWHLPALYPLYVLAARLHCCRCCLSARCTATTSSGAAMKCRSSGMRPHGMMARMRPRLAEVAPRRAAAASLTARADVVAARIRRQRRDLD